MANERLRKAIASAHATIDEVAETTGTNPKTVQRWLKGRVPHARHRWAVAKLVGEDEKFLWPSSETELASGNGSTAEVIAAYAHRADVPPELWWDLLVEAKREISLCGYAILFLPEAHPRLTDLLRGKAAASCQIRIALADPSSALVAERDAEEQLDGALAGRIRTALLYFGDLAGCDGVELTLHSTPMYNSTFRFDDEMFVTPHLYGRPGFAAPLLHLRRLGQGGVFDNFAAHFEAVWESSFSPDRALFDANRALQRS